MQRIQGQPESTSTLSAEFKALMGESDAQARVTAYFHQFANRLVPHREKSPNLKRKRGRAIPYKEKHSSAR